MERAHDAALRVVRFAVRGDVSLRPRCPPGADVEFIVRLSDGRTYARTVAAGGAAPLSLMRGGYITGPAGAPLGFYRRLPASDAPRAAPPPDLTDDPLRTIATVTALDVAYRITVAGNEIDRRHRYDASRAGTRCATRKRTRYATCGSRATATKSCGSTYALPFKRSAALVTYDFAPVGEPPLWSIVHVAASAGGEAISEDLREIAFPSDEPESYFTPL